MLTGSATNKHDVEPTMIALLRNESKAPSVYWSYTTLLEKER